MKFKYLALLALTTCTLIVIGAGIARAMLMPDVSMASLLNPSVIAQSAPAQQATPAEIAALNQATLTYLRQGRENLPQAPSISRTIIRENYGLVSWIWGEAGGQSVLALTDDGWTVLTSGGGAIDVAGMEAVGVPSAIAQQLIETDRAAWKQQENR